MKVGDLVYIKDGFEHEPICIGVGLVLGETEIYDNCALKWKSTTPVFFEGRVQYFDRPYWELEVIKKRAPPD